MKKIFVTFVLALLFLNTALNTALAQFPTPVNRWMFNDGTGTTAVDSVSGNTINLSGTTGWVPDKNGNANHALEMITAYAAFTTPTSSTTTFSISIWFNISSSVTQALFIDNASYRALYLIPGTGYRVYDGSANHDISTTDPTVGTWYHIVLTCNSGAAVLYLNGNSIGTFTMTGSQSYNEIGSDAPFFTSYTIDDAQYFDVNLTSAEVTALYNAGPDGTPIPPPPAPDLLWLKLGSDATDSSGLGNDGTLQGSPTFVAQSGVNCVSLNGTSQYITLASAPVATVSTGSSYSCSSWVYVPTLTGNRMEWTPDPSFVNGNLALSSFIDGNFLCANASSAGVCNDVSDEVTTFPTGIWTLVTSTFDGGTGQQVVYRGSTAVATKTYGSCANSGTSVSTSTWSIGAYLFSGTPGGFFQGKMADVKMYGHVLTPTEVGEINAAGPPTNGVPQLTNYYVSQNGAGLMNGNSPANAYPLTWMTNTANWNNGDGTILAGNTVTLEGTITNQIYIQGSGTLGNYITIKFDTGAKYSFLTLPTNALGSPIIQETSQSYIIIDGGTNVDGSINGLLTLTDNGTVSSNGGTHTFNNSSAIGIALAGTTHDIIIKNLVISNLYDRQNNADPNTACPTCNYGTGITINQNTSDLMVSNVVLTGMQDCIDYPFISAGVTTSNITFTYCSLSNFNHGFSIDGSSGSKIDGLTVTHCKVQTGNSFECPDYKWTDSNSVVHYATNMIVPPLYYLNSPANGGVPFWSSTSNYTFSTLSNTVVIIMNGPDADYYLLAKSSLNNNPTNSPTFWYALNGGAGNDFLYHRDLFIIFSSVDVAYITNMTFAYNLFQNGDSNAQSVTAGTGVFLFNTIQINHLLSYNNIFQANFPSGFSGGTCMIAMGTNSLFANNDIIGWTNGILGGGIEAGAGATVYQFPLVSQIVANNYFNIGQNFWLELYPPSNTITESSYADFFSNMYFDNNVYNGNINFNILFTYPGLTGSHLFPGNTLNTLFQWTNQFFTNTPSIAVDVHSSTTPAIYNPITWVPALNDTALNKQGTNLSSFFTDDFYGHPRPPTGNWTVGAVQGGKVYYVDYASGSDSNDGLTTSTPWQHCPGDTTATSVPLGTTLIAGDTVRFKGGVTYVMNVVNPTATAVLSGDTPPHWLIGAFIPGIVVSSSGTQTSPITYDGNSDGSWGAGRAIITDNFSTNNICAFANLSTVISNVNFLSLVFTNIGGSNSFPTNNFYPYGFMPKPGGGINFPGVLNMTISNCYFGELGYYQEFPTNMSNGSLAGGGIGIQGATNLTILNCEFTQMRNPIFLSTATFANINIGKCFLHDQMEWGLGMPISSTNCYRSNVFIHDCIWSNTDQYYAGVSDNGDGTSTRVGPWMGYTTDTYPDGSPRSSGGPHQNEIMMFNAELSDGSISEDRNGDTNLCVYNNKFITTKTNSGGSTGCWFQNSTAVYFYNNIFYHCAANNALAIGGFATNCSQYFSGVYNNTFYMFGTAFNTYPDVTGWTYTNTGIFVDVRNNIFSTLNIGYNNASDYQFQGSSADLAKMTNNIRMDYNCYFCDSFVTGGIYAINGVETQIPLQFTQPVAVTYGWDVHSICDKGLINFINVTPNTTTAPFDLHLQQSSPAILQGVNLTSLNLPGLTNDADGNPRPTNGPWTMGAYNFTPLSKARIRPSQSLTGSPPADPTTISGCKVYLNASKITGLVDGNSVTRWKDLSGNGNDAIQYQFGDSLRPCPTYKINVINGLPAVRFDGEYQFLSNSYPILSGASTIVLVAVKNITGANFISGVNARPSSSHLYNVILISSTSGDQWGTYMNNPQNSSYSDNIWRMMVSVSDGNLSSPQNILYTDNNSPETVTDSSRYTGDSFNNMAIGCNDALSSRPDSFFKGDMYAIIIYNRAITSGERTTLYNYFHYYGIIP